MLLFDTLFEKAISADELDLFIRENIEKINEFANMNYCALDECRESIENFILLKNQTLVNLNYERTYNKAFVSILIEICERLGEESSLIQLYSILQNNDIYIGERLNAVLLYLHGIKANHEFLEHFDSICQKLEFASENEEDNTNKPVATFLNFYSYVINNVKPLRFAEELRQQIEIVIEKKSYGFLQHISISKALSFSLENIGNAFNEIQKLIDDLLGVVEVLDIHYSADNLLIEEETEYSELINSAKISFDSIREISIGKTNGQAFTNRGAGILETDAQLYTYMYRFGNMHKAKLDSAFAYLPVDLFSANINIIDWGCGQGMASIVLLDRLNPDNVKSCILIEPSTKALKRAALHIKLYNPDLKLKTICKKLDNLKAEDFPTSKEVTLHLFSNILDIDDYNQLQLAELISATQNGENYFVCVSPYIDDRKTDRVDNFKRYFEKRFSSTFQLLGENMNSGRLNDSYWNCNNNLRGNMGVYCNHPECGCEKKWTRVSKVFKI